MKIILSIIAFSLALVSVFACPTVTATNTNELIAQIPSLDAQIQTCPIILNGLIARLVGNGELQVDVAMPDGSTQSFALIKSGKQITGASTNINKPAYTISLNDDAVSKLLASTDKFGTFTFLFKIGQIKIKAVRLWNKITLGIAKPFIGFFAPKIAPAQPQAAYMPPNLLTGELPDNCDETYLPGHSGYGANQALWDSYSADSTGVCQSQYGRGLPGPCKHTVQLSVSGNPYYLCWY